MGRFHRPLRGVDQVESARASPAISTRCISATAPSSRRATCSSPSTSGPTRPRSSRRRRRSPRRRRGSNSRRAISSAPSSCARPATSPTSCSTSGGKPSLTAQGRTRPRQADAAPGAELDLEFTEIQAPIAGPHLAQARLGGQSRQRQPDGADQHRLARPDPFLFRRRRALLPRLFAPGPGGTRTSTRPGAATRSRVALTDEREPQPQGPDRLPRQPARRGERHDARRAPIFDNKDLFLTPGLFGRVSIAGSDPYRGVLVPDEAIGSDQDRRIVYVVGDDNKVDAAARAPRAAHRRLSRRSATGLKGDETIVVNGLVRVRPGVKVEPQIDATLPPHPRTQRLEPRRPPAGVRRHAVRPFLRRPADLRHRAVDRHAASSAASPIRACRSRSIPRSRRRPSWCARPIPAPTPRPSRRPWRRRSSSRSTASRTCSTCPPTPPATARCR